MTLSRYQPPSRPLNNCIKPSAVRQAAYMASRTTVYAALGCGVLIVSCAAILIRIAQAEGMSPLAIAAGRMCIASFVLLPLAARGADEGFRALHWRQGAVIGAAGVCLAVHFAAWISSLRYTTVASSTVLVTTNPIWVGLASIFILRERLSKPVVLGIALAICGTSMMFVANSGNHDSGSHGRLYGDALALLGAVSASAYLIIGRAQRASIGLLSYVTLVYSVAAAVLFVAMMAHGDRILGHSATAYACVLALGLGPQLIGHTILNWSVRHVSATVVALSILGEPIGSTLLALAIFGERIDLSQSLAFALILAGIFLSSRSKVES